MFRELLTLEKAKQVIYQHFRPKPLGVEQVKLLEAHNRILAEDITAAINVPPFDRSTVDGYTVKAEDTFGAEENKPVRLKICGTVNVGEAPRIAVKQGAAAEIVTGAPIPKGADAVVMVEDTERKNNGIYIYNAVTKYENVMKSGADIKEGATVLKKGELLRSSEIGVLAALGMVEVKVYVIPHVAVLSTGAEVSEPGKRLTSGKIYDINAYSLSAAVFESGGKPIYFGVFPDNMDELQKALRRALASADMVITSGGVSVGPKDVMPKTLGTLGKPGVIVCGIAMKPGKPTTVALIDGKLVFALPGHPTSALLVFYLLVRPIIQYMVGARAKARADLRVKARAAVRMFPAKGRRTFIMVRLKRDEKSRLMAQPVLSGLSGAITTLADADGFVEIAEDQQFIESNDEVIVHLFRSLEKGGF